MKRLQRYVSTELTHFLGRTCEDDESRYELLKTILSSGKLEPRRVGHILSEGGISIVIRGKSKLSTNKVYETEVVCFCDIPVEDLEFHMRKYSRFGLSFPKSFLVKKEANPVFYVAKDAVDRYPSIQGRRLGGSKIRRAHSFDAFFAAYRGAFNELFHWVATNSPSRKDVPKKLVEVLEEVLNLSSFLDDLFSYFKFFDSNQPEASESNFYMEREWRVRGTVEFLLDDVQRVIFPSDYARRFRHDFPEFFGEITFSD